jgi:antitoxin CptB
MNDHAYNRLHWQCRRGMLELDLMLQGYLEKSYAGMSEDDKSLFAALLEAPDPILYAWCMGHVTPTESDQLRVVKQIRTTSYA